MELITAKAAAKVVDLQYEVHRATTTTTTSPVVPTTEVAAVLTQADRLAVAKDRNQVQAEQAALRVKILEEDKIKLTLNLTPGVVSPSRV